MIRPYEGGVPMNVISAFIKETLENSLAPSARQGHREDKVSSCILPNHVLKPFLSLSLSSGLLHAKLSPENGCETLRTCTPPIQEIVHAPLPGRACLAK